MKLLKAFWKRLRSPSKAAMGFILLIGFSGSLILWGGFNAVMEASSTEEFCGDCHAPIVEEIQETIHYSNRSGVRAECADCHLPHDWPSKLARKLQASKEIYGDLIGVIDTDEKFNERRLEIASVEWQRLKANDSQECRNCHQFEFMDFSEQGPRGARLHATELASGEKTCIDCHKGIAHELPDMHGVEGW
ncbi:NapC/NirT family cytochrome c [Vibrio sp. SS-MA-C1-2]|uniref:NapC/NirT family cytochrome c n=1 Tax=Vibrio sp. SS-MA-C1-2 TaxID=2908646 RepID=UPI001F2F013B|nr:NapC/NirT family cytochrome c [Vibrio sp. SS-MA-C1-2]UJF16918.1 NapC/NirT family cytochrome c [Vibrio sp. SS-MA-C1-2]